MNSNVNPYLKNRLETIQKSLIIHYSGGKYMPNSMKGTEREVLINEYLSKILSPIYRFGSGSIVDANENLSGQVDVVIELPFAPSFPMPAANERLYLAESVAVVIEVKSDISKQWNQVKNTTKKIKKLTRHLEGGFMRENAEPEKIPCYAVGYTGYKTIKTLEKRILSTPKDSRPDGALVINSGCFVGLDDKGKRASVDGAWGLYYLIIELLYHVQKIVIATPDFSRYVGK